MTEIKGYRTLSDVQKMHINAVKEKEQDFLLLLAAFLAPEFPLPYKIDERWLSIARTHLEEASMAACRAISRPDTVNF